jgi:ubiquinone/menaquinone biosynthesis C-methylase UbiE
MRRQNVGDWPYQATSLAFYDYLILHLSTQYIWKYPLPVLQSLYDEHLSSNHLEIGVGTGYLLDYCQSIHQGHTITLMDLNLLPLQRTRQRLRRYHTQVCLADVLNPLPFRGHSFASVGINFVLHCLPGTYEKLSVFRSIRSVMAEKATLFGSTVLASAKENNIVADKLMQFYNKTNAFHNEHDTAERFAKALQDVFEDVETEVVGGVLKFVAHS